MIKLFGTTIRETKMALSSMLHYGTAESAGPNAEDRLKVIGRIVVTILMIFLATYLFSTGEKTTGGTIVGAIIGYWIK